MTLPDDIERRDRQTADTAPQIAQQIDYWAKSIESKLRALIASADRIIALLDQRNPARPGRIAAPLDTRPEPAAVPDTPDLEGHPRQLRDGTWGAGGTTPNPREDLTRGRMVAVRVTTKAGQDRGISWHRIEASGEVSDGPDTGSQWWIAAPIDPPANDYPIPGYGPGEEPF